MRAWQVHRHPPAASRAVAAAAAAAGAAVGTIPEIPGAGPGGFPGAAREIPGGFRIVAGEWTHLSLAAGRRLDRLGRPCPCGVCVCAFRPRQWVRHLGWFPLPTNRRPAAGLRTARQGLSRHWIHGLARVRVRGPDPFDPVSGPGRTPLLPQGIPVGLVRRVPGRQELELPSWVPIRL